MHVEDDSYTIRLTDTPKGRNTASMLIKRMYAWRGYTGTFLTSNDPNRITLTASDEGDVVGTLTIGMDSEAGLLADAVFKDILDEHRARGARLCECTRFAFDPSVRSKAALANVFHLAVIYARDLHGCTDIVIEVNPRHRRFYERMLGFRQEGELRTNTRVGAPAYLLRINLRFATQQIRRFGGTCMSGAAEERSLYPFFFSPREERGIIDRLLRMHESQPTS